MLPATLCNTVLLKCTLHGGDHADECPSIVQGMSKKEILRALTSGQLAVTTILHNCSNVQNSKDSRNFNYSLNIRLY